MKGIISCAVFGSVLFRSTSTAFDKQVNEKGLLEWIHSEGGFWNPKLELRYDDNIPDLYGVFAKEDIPVHAILASIPWSCVIHVGSDHPDRFDSDCNMVKRLSEELQAYKKGKASNYSYYVEGLIHTAEEHSKLLPAYWSEAGKELLSEIFYDEESRVLPPEDLFLDEDDWRHNCESNVDPTATLLVLTHGEDFGMVPLTDKFNSRGGNYTGAYFSMQNGEGDIALEIRALRPLKKGEQIYTDYHDYGAIGTPELLRDYGFVEAFPQRWIFHQYGVGFDVVQTTNSGFRVKWLRSHGYLGDPGVVGGRVAYVVANHMKNQLDRLEQKVQPLLSSTSIQEDGPSVFELKTIQQFSENLTRALKLALENMDANLWSEEL